MGYPSLQVQCAFGVDWRTFPTEDDWEDITQYFEGGRISMGRKSDLDRFEAGVFEASLVNTDRRFEEGYAGSPYSPNVVPDQWVRVRTSYGGKFGSALSFDGTNDYVDMGDVHDRTGTSSFTFEAWVNRSSTGTEDVIVSKDNGTNGYAFRILTTGVLNCYRRVAGTATSRSGNTSLTLGVWHHVAAVYDGSNISIYLDGALDNTPASGGGSVADITTSFRVGQRQSTHYFHGLIDDVRIWSTARTAAEIAATMDQELIGLEPGLVGYYKFNEATGTEARDSSITGAHGTLTNGPTWVGDMKYQFTGFTESWKPDWHRPGRCQMTAVDVFKLLAIRSVDHPYVAEVLRDAPLVYWRFGEASVDDPIADFSGHGQNGQYLGAPLFNQADPITDAVDGAIKLNTVIDGGVGQSGFSGTGAFSVEMWLYTGQGGIFMALNQLEHPQFGLGGGFSLGQEATGKARFGVQDALTGTTSTLTGTTNIANAGYFHLVGVREAGGTLRLYVNGVQQATSTPALAADIPIKPLWIGRANDGVAFVDEVAVYDDALSAARVLAHFNARTAGDNELTGTRINRILDLADYPTSKRSIDAGISRVQAAVKIGNLLEHAKSVARTENGGFYAMGNGDVRFRDRHAVLRAPYTVSQVTIGFGAGELPYKKIVPETNDTDLRNEVRLQRAGGVEQMAKDDSSRYMPRTYRDGNLLHTNDNEVRDQTFYILDRYKEARLSFDSVILNPRQNDGLWPHVLGRWLEDHVTAKQSLPGGGVVSKSGLIQFIEHRIDKGRKWETEWKLGQLDLREFWLVGVAGRSEIGVTTRVGY